MSELGSFSPRVRERMIKTLRERGIVNLSVLEVMGQLPRHEFIEEAFRHRSYDGDALPIGSKQTISQPYTVAKMTEAVLSTEGKLDNVLEIGTGSGYQSAVLSSLVGTVYSVERIKKLIPRARAVLDKLNIKNVHIKHADGHLGWSEKQPFDAIITTAASKGVPSLLYDQLRMGGKIIIPVGVEGESQELIEVTKTPLGHAYNFIQEVKFVPMLHGEEN